MAGKSAKDTLILVDQFNISSFLDSADLSRTRSALGTTTFSQDSKTFILDVKDASMTFSGLADTLPTGINKIMDDRHGSASVLVTYAVEDAHGAYAYLIDAAEADIGNESSISGLLRISGTFQAQQDGGDSGVIIFPVTIDTATANGAVHDRGVGNTTSAGNVAHLHVTAASGTTPTLDVLIQMDTNAAFTSPTTLVTFTQAVAATSQRVENTTSTERYIRISYTIAGTTPAFTFAVSWAPR